MQELGKCNLKVNVITNRVEKYMSFTINNKLVFNDSFQFLRPLKYLSQEFDNNVLDLFKKKDFILMNTWVILESLKKNYLAKKCFIAH